MQKNERITNIFARIAGGEAEAILYHSLAFLKLKKGVFIFKIDKGIKSIFPIDTGLLQLSSLQFLHKFTNKNKKTLKMPILVISNLLKLSLTTVII